MYLVSAAKSDRSVVDLAAAKSQSLHGTQLLTILAQGAVKIGKVHPRLLPKAAQLQVRRPAIRLVFVFAPLRH